MLSEQEKALRRTGVTGSDPACIAGFSPYRSAIQVWLHKTDPLHEEETSEQMEIGDALEDVTCRQYAKRVGASKMERRTTMIHPDRRLMLATPDRLATVSGELVLVEAKSAAGWNARDDFGAEGTPEIPDHFFAQVQHNCQVVGAKRWALPVLFNGRAPVVIFQGVLEQAYAKSQWEMEMDFWTSHVEKRIPPEPDGHDSYRGYLKAAFSKAQNEVLFAATEEQEKWMAAYAEARDLEKHWEELKALAWQHLTAAIGPASGIQGEWGKATWLNNKDGIATDWEAACREAGVPEELILKHTLPKPGGRTLRVTKAKAKEGSMNTESIEDAGRADEVPDKPMEAYISTTEAARILGISIRTLTRLSQSPGKSGLPYEYVQIPSYRIGRFKKYLPSELRAWRKATREVA